MPMTSGSAAVRGLRRAAAGYGPRLGGSSSGRPGAHRGAAPRPCCRWRSRVGSAEVRRRPGRGGAASSARCGIGGPPKPPPGTRASVPVVGVRGGAVTSTQRRYPHPLCAVRLPRAVQWEARAVQCETPIFVLF